MTDPTSRALKLLSLLGHRAVWSGPELAAELGVTPRTLRRDVDRVRNLGYTVDAEPGQGGGYALRRGQALPALSLDEDEALAVNLALTVTTGQVANAEVVSRALAKIDGILPPAARLKARELRASTDMSRMTASVDQGILADCADAVRLRRRLRFSYVDRNGVLTERWVEPHQVSCRGRVWYLAAYDVAREAWRSFRLDRMADMRVGGWIFRRRADSDEALESLREPMPLGAYKHRVVIHAKLAAEDAPEYMHWGSSELREIKPGVSEFTTGADSPQQAAEWLILLPCEFTVVADAEVRAAVAALGDRLRRAAGSTPSDP
ncbi:WYL domain-containing protein [Kocuria sp. cx-455]|uniref:helix-turn-helix transcriptional regulator n=1 Tax=Kocuria sp. cx-455 TaxID=2771377 RepID=UPI001683DF06|nr:WYL domain-containing protein [Kocuria sp. cx-455]MBD2765854.1 WYL domain-containing protein [Kocuria sp. cx-455]